MAAMVPAAPAPMTMIFFRRALREDAKRLRR
jgi:hypothetical protein